MDPEIFFPTPHAGRNDVARAVCKRCPVIEECLEYILQEEVGGYRFGIWAGLNSEERKAIAVERGLVRRKRKGQWST